MINMVLGIDEHGIGDDGMLIAAEFLPCGQVHTDERDRLARRVEVAVVIHVGMNLITRAAKQLSSFPVHNVVFQRE